MLSVPQARIVTITDRQVRFIFCNTGNCLMVFFKYKNFKVYNCGNSLKLKVLKTITKFLLNTYLYIEIKLRLRKPASIDLMFR